jgi:hypothetical protein
MAKMHRLANKCERTQIHNGEKRWYALKDRKLARRAKGQILLECDLVFNSVKASIRTFNPMEQKYIDQEKKFKRQVLMRNVNRVKHFALVAVDVGNFMKSMFSWESPLRSAIGFVVSVTRLPERVFFFTHHLPTQAFMVITYSFELYMLPLTLLIFFVKAYVHKSIVDNLTIRQPELEVNLF